MTKDSISGQKSRLLYFHVVFFDSNVRRSDCAICVSSFKKGPKRQKSLLFSTPFLNRPGFVWDPQWIFFLP